MSVDSVAANPGLPRFHRAATQARAFTITWWTCINASLVLMLIIWRVPTASWRPLLIVNTAMILLLGATVQAAYWVVRWRALITRTPEHAHPSPLNVLPTSRWFGWLRIGQQRVASALRSMQRRISVDGWAALGMAALSSLVLLLIIATWNAQLQPMSADRVAKVVAGIALAYAFGLLVMERYCAGALLHELPEAAQLASMLRVAIGIALLSAICLLLSNESRRWPLRLTMWLGWVPALLATELLLRALLSVFAPREPQREPTVLAASLLANLLGSLATWPPRPIHQLQAELKDRFGIDLRQSWAFAYIKRASLPVMGVLVGVAWLLSSVFEVSNDARGIYERFGAPVAVWSPGLHVGLPWPFARMRLVENGVVHELATASASDDNNGSSDAAVADAEGPSPASANRLWDASHVAEKSQLIASEANAQSGINQAGTRQSFHIVNLDVRFMYRIGLKDVDALNATYNSNDVPTLIRSAANRILVSYFASRTLEGVLGERRTQLALDIGKRVQADLDALHSGVEIMATVVEAIHPPAAAANAYHSVQAAQISAQAIIARERGAAAEQVNVAQLRAGLALTQAAASARETTATAETAERRFAAERDAYRTAGRAFLFEQYLEQLSKGLASAQWVVIDHRLRAANASLDLRSVAAPLDNPTRSTP